MDLAFWAFLVLQLLGFVWFVRLAIAYERNRKRLRDLEGWVYRDEKPRK